MNGNTNRYETSLPFKDDFVLLPGNYELCRKRMCLYKMLKNDPELLETYEKFSRNSYLMELLNKLILQTRNQVKHTIFHTTQLFGLIKKL